MFCCLCCSLYVCLFVVAVLSSHLAVSFILVLTDYPGRCSYFVLEQRSNEFIDHPAVADFSHEY